MEYVNVGSSGLKVSRFCLGTMTFGGQTEKAEAIKMVDHCIDNGVNFFDTADIYTQGVSEKILGEALKGKRDNQVIATKVCGPHGKGPNMSGLGRKHIISSVKESLESLQTDYIDILYMHSPDNSTADDEIIETMTDLVREGLIRYYAVSNFSSWQACKFIHKAKETGKVAPICSQSVYNILTRGLDEEMIPFMKEYKFGLCVYNPLAGGLLTGKHTKTPEKGSRFDLEKGYYDRYFNDDNLDYVAKVVELAKKEDMSAVEFSLKWLTQNPVVTSVIVGASKLSQVEENVSYLNNDKLISAEGLQEADKIWKDIKGKYFNYHR